MSIKAPFGLVLLSLLLYSCEENLNNENIERIDISIGTATDGYLTDFFSSISIYELSSEEVFIGSITKIHRLEEFIFVLDKDYTNSLYKFDSSGSYIQKIGVEGEGPTEYQDINDFTVVNNNGTIELWILDNSKGYFSILKYDAQGNFLAKIRSTLFADSFEFVEPKYLVFSTSNQCNDNFCSNTYTTDLDLNILSKGYESQPPYKELWIEPSNPISVVNNETAIVSYGDFNIYSLDSAATIFPLIKVNLVDRKTSKDLNERHIYPDSYYQSLIEMGLCYDLDNVFLFNEHLFFSLTCGNQNYFCFASNQEISIVKGLKLNDKVKLNSINIVGRDNESIYCYFDPEAILSFLESSEPYNEGILLDKFSLISRESLTNSNPPIIRLKLK